MAFWESMMNLRRIFLKFLCSPRPVDLHHCLGNTVFEPAAQKGYGAWNGMGLWQEGIWGHDNGQLRDWHLPLSKWSLKRPLKITYPYTNRWQEFGPLKFSHSQWIADFFKWFLVVAPMARYHRVSIRGWMLELFVFRGFRLKFWSRSDHPGLDHLISIVQREVMVTYRKMLGPSHCSLTPKTLLNPPASFQNYVIYMPSF